MTDTKKETWQERRDRLAEDSYPDRGPFDVVSQHCVRAFEKGFTVGRADALAEAEEILVKALDWYWGNWGTSNPELRSAGYKLAQEALTAWKKARGE